MNPVSDRLLLRKSGSTENRTRDLWMCSKGHWPLDHRGDRMQSTVHIKSAVMVEYKILTARSQVKDWLPGYQAVTQQWTGYLVTKQ
jgi:hypothetical protein